MSTPLVGNDFSYFGVGDAKVKQKELNTETFLRLLTVQMSNQNPLEPMKDAEYFSQIAQMGQMQGMNDLKGSMEISQGTAMIGKTVKAMRPMTDAGAVGNQYVTGQVTKVTVRDGKRLITIEPHEGGSVQVEMRFVREVG